MRSRFFVLALCVLTLTATSASEAQQKDDELFLAGMHLRLGMPEGAILKTLAGQTSYSLRPTLVSPNSYLIMGKHPFTGQPVQTGQISFTNGRLSFATKEWATDCKDVIEALQAIFAAARPEGEGTAWFKAQILQQPGASVTVITFAVGKRRITVSTTTIKDVGKFINVDEAIGAKNIP